MLTSVTNLIHNFLDITIKYLSRVVALKLDERKGADAIQDNLKTYKPSVSLVDLPAGE